MVVSSPPVFAYYSNYVLAGGLFYEVVMKIAVSEFLILTTMYFVADVCDGVLFRASIYRRVSDYECIIAPLPAGYIDHIGHTEFFRIVEDSSFDGSLDMFAYERSGEIDWSRVNYEDP